MIPKRFSVMGREVRVRYVEDLVSSHDCYGVWMPSKNIIALQMPDQNHCESVIAQSFWHEVMHCIFESLGRNDLSKKEALVEQIGQCLYQLDKSKR